MSIRIREIYANSKRIAWIDNVKFLAIWCVIFGHCNGQMFTCDRIGFEWVNLLIVVFNMPLFMLMSGYSNYNALQRLTSLKALGIYLFKSFERIALPCIIPCILLYFIRTDLNTINFKLYWFCVMLVAVQIIAGVVFFVGNKFKLHDSLKWIVFLCITLMLPQYAICELSPYFLLGGAAKTLQTSDNKIIALLKNSTLLSVLIGVIGLVIFPFVGKYQFYSYNIHNMMSGGLVHIWLLRFVCACCLMYTIIFWVRRLTGKYSVISYMGSKSLGLYIWHGLMLDSFRRLNYRFSGDAAWSWIYITIAVFFTTIAITAWIWVLEQNRITKYLFFGIRK